MAEGNELAVMHSSVVGHHHHHALLMAQPMMDAEMEMASQRFLLEQQVCTDVQKILHFLKEFNLNSQNLFFLVLLKTIIPNSFSCSWSK